MINNITIIDYGSGNLRSAQKAFEHVASNAAVKVTSNPADIKNATHIVLPGVGAFGDCAAGLNSINGMVDELAEQVLGQKKPFLGICVGMQLLANTGFEHGTHKGLGWIEGEVKLINSNNLPVPHMGWNGLNSKKPHNLLKNINSDVYFVHSYGFIAANPQDIVATTTYGSEITAIIAHNNIMGVQFHPEKSQQAGLQLLRNFLTI